jgi:diketogulonate reductase-like aldo/keto reductase
LIVAHLGAVTTPDRVSSPTLLDKATIVPAVNQIEVHPYFAQREV